MSSEKDRKSLVYRRLIGLYPRAFRERFAESMEQTFDDVCNEREAMTGRIDNVFLFSVFAETAVGAVRENLCEFKGVLMENLRLRVILAFASGILATAPFVILEWFYTGGFPLGFPFAIFNVLFIEAALFAFLVLSLLKTPFREPALGWIAPFSLKIALAIPLALSWTHIVADQMPCFFGGRGC